MPSSECMEALGALFEFPLRPRTTKDHHSELVLPTPESLKSISNSSPEKGHPSCTPELFEPAALNTNRYI